MNVYLDTETNGLNDEAEIIQIGVINDNGSVLIDTLIQCQGDIPTEVSAINGITKNDLSCAPTFPQVFDKICETLKNAEVVLIYNAEFDLRLLKQTSKRYGLQMPDINASCVMLGYAHKFNNGKRRKLVDACDDLLIYTADVILHSAVGDCELTRRLNNKMKLEIAEEQLQREKRRKSRDPSVNISQGIQKTFSHRLECRFDGVIGSIGCSYTYQGMLSFKEDFWQ